jgi:hypothetical protein
LHVIVRSLTHNGSLSDTDPFIIIIIIIIIVITTTRDPAYSDQLKQTPLPSIQQAKMDQPVTKNEKALGEDFNRRVQDLPPELYSMVYDYTFSTSTAPAKITFTESYKPPALLYVDRHSRRRFAKVYYGETDFCAPNSATILSPWLRPVPEERRASLLDVLWTSLGFDCLETRGWHMLWEEAFSRFVLRQQ